MTLYYDLIEYIHKKNKK